MARCTKSFTEAPRRAKAPEGAHTTAEVAAAQEGAKPGPTGENLHEPRSPSIPVTAQASFSIPRRNTSGRWHSIAKDSFIIGTGDRGEIFRVDRNGNGSLFFKSDEAQIRALDFDNPGNLIAGTDGSGLIYRISPQGEGFRAVQRAQERDHRAGR